MWSTSRYVVPGLAAAALASTLLWASAAVDRSLASGFVLEVVPRDPRAAARQVPTLDLDAARARRLAPARPAVARWTGWLHVDRDEACEMIVGARGRSRVIVDGRVVADHDGRPRRLTVPVRLASGPRLVVVEHEMESDDGYVRVALVRGSAEPRRLDAMGIFRQPPAAGARRLHASGRVAGPVALVLLVALGGIATGRLRSMPDERRTRIVRRAAHAAAALIVLYGAALRVHALAAKYEDTAPRWMTRAIPIIREIHPRGMRWIPPEHPYEGDPFGYLRCAREMRGFYDASVREPVFVFATKLALGATGDRDIAVNLASAGFSTLLVGAVYVLGFVAFSPVVGLVAALAMAIERQAVALGVDGWRDDAFAFFVVISAVALLRLRERPSWPTGLLAGLVFAGATLTRITSLSFLVPGLALVLLSGTEPRRRRWNAVALSVALATLLVLPFLVSCAVAYGDAFHSINAHTRFYRSRAAGAPQAESGVLTLLSEGGGPLTLADTALVGLTWYPFANKWEHFDYWAPWLGPALAAAALCGLVLWTRSGRSRLLLAVLFSSLLPYAFTWGIPGGSEWRFTLHAYPFYLVAAASAPGLLRDAARRVRAQRTRRVVLGVFLATAAAAVLYAALCALAYGRVREEIAAGRESTIACGLRDAWFFADGWSRPVRVGHVRARSAETAAASVRLPLVEGRAYRLVLRLDPTTAADTRVAVSLNGTALAEWSLIHDDRRFGSYEVEVPASQARAGANHFTFHTAAGSGFRLWFVRVSPAGR